jgi:predicted nucleic acid-binding Zn ribbon protein
MRKSNEQSLGEVIKLFLKSIKAEDKITEVRIFAAWEKIMGKQIHALTEKVIFRDKTLTVFLKSSTLREELSHAKTKIIEKINKEVGQNAVSVINLR